MTIFIPQPSDIDPKEVSPGALRAFFRICDTWKLSSEEIADILMTDCLQIQEWKVSTDSVVLQEIILERISYVFGIFSDLNRIFSDHVQADAWVKLPNAAEIFKGKTAVELMRSANNDDLAELRKYLDGIVGGTEDEIGLYEHDHTASVNL